MTILNAFWVGGLICLIAQILISKTKLTPARILVGLVVLGVVLGGLGLMEPLKKFAGAGVSVPLLGFGDLMAQGIKEAIAKDGALGILTGGLTAGAAGIAFVIILGVIASILSKPKEK
ncbi:MAG: SpoVA/SpoVAEb family sporulation membrane protein [Clostridia bacterium]|nr:SpoVA/SpoVAEb family sporulation membrane protein [Clostridia bacterium]